MKKATSDEMALALVSMKNVGSDGSRLVLEHGLLQPNW
jgi:hypothetical protein